MQPRQFLVVAAAIVVAFAAAFGIAKASGGGEEAAPASAPEPQAAEVIEVSEAKVSNGVSAAAGLPALQVPKPKPEEEVVDAETGHACRPRVR